MVCKRCGVNEVEDDFLEEGMCIECLEKLEEEYYAERFENDELKHIWGLLSGDNMSYEDCCLYSMNDIELIYWKRERKYSVFIEAIYSFGTEEDCCNYLKRLRDIFTVWMHDNGYNTNQKKQFFSVFACGDSVDAKFDSIEEAYSNFNFFVKAYCNEHKN